MPWWPVLPRGCCYAALFLVAIEVKGFKLATMAHGRTISARYDDDANSQAAAVEYEVIQFQWCRLPVPQALFVGGSSPYRRGIRPQNSRSRLTDGWIFSFDQGTQMSSACGSLDNCHGSLAVPQDAKGRDAVAGGLGASFRLLAALFVHKVMDSGLHQHHTFSKASRYRLRSQVSH